MDAQYLPRANFQSLIDAVLDQGFSLLGPRIRDGALVFDRLDSVHQLPQGYVEEQAPGSYTLYKDRSSDWFAWTNGPQALKPLLFKSREILWQAKKDEQGRLCFQQHVTDHKPMAVLGVRACDLAALRLQDKHFLGTQFNDEAYQSRRSGLLLLGVNCTRAADTCFCSSTGDGPEISNGADIRLTELENGFVLWADSEPGLQIMQQLHTIPATSEQLQQAQLRSTEAGDSQHRQLADLGELVTPSLLDSEQWDAIAKQCLSCGNCTSVCPSCFCSELIDEVDLEENCSLHYRQWSSCFTKDHSYMHGLYTRPDTRLQYRQWFLHKLIIWKQQYGRSGCVGCGRCISWCPVGIDITQLAGTLSG